MPVDSPVSESGLLFYQTLYDEHAVCHLALGRAFPMCLEGGSRMDESELERHSSNRSLVHEDFMVCSDDLDIDGIMADGAEEPIFRRGRWAF